NEPNFITNQNVTGEVLILRDLIKSKKYTNKIICIENADPGYDFLFSYNIKGLITKYGGINSHMAIRCNELNIPAAIGVGDKIFSELIYSNKAQLNCTNNTLKLI
ncbi:PEP-utilizing enzyme, partial [Candidatus Pelagibacter bacterium]|nr:PEP-utilizing enzyme [Candidatus Pelagibacter bacterium]